MTPPRLVEVETIDCVIEQLKYVRDRYEEENDELRMEVSAITQQRDDLLDALEFMMRATAEWPGDMSASIDAIRDKANAAIAKAGGEQ